MAEDARKADAFEAPFEPYIIDTQLIVPSVIEHLRGSHVPLNQHLIAKSTKFLPPLIGCDQIPRNLN